MTNKFKNGASLAALIVAAGLATQGLSTPAQAGGSVSAHPVNWGGLYLGVHLGYGEVDVAGTFANNVPTSESMVFVEDLDLDGPLAGVHAGYNIDYGVVVFGLEADVSVMDWTGVAHAIDSTDTVIGEVNSLSTIRARLGLPIAANRAALAYLTGGIAIPEVDVTIYPSGRGDSGQFSQPRKFEFEDVGVVIGGGFELAATKSFRMRAEGLYYLFDERQRPVMVSAETADFIELDDAFVIRIGGSVYIN